jgi:hypothetical protein
MLNHTVLGPRNGRFHVVYPTPGTDLPTSVCDAATFVAAQIEADRLNRRQVAADAAIQEERRLCGLWRIVDGH